ncbi:Zinc transporter 1 [Balamuthia mandrillaris]
MEPSEQRSLLRDHHQQMKEKEQVEEVSVEPEGVGDEKELGSSFTTAQSHPSPHHQHYNQRKMSHSLRMGHHHRRRMDLKLLSFVVIGLLTLIYTLGELGAAIYLHSLALLSDGFHNLSDVVSLYIAFWATRAAKRQSSDAMSYGWVRSEILGGLTNGCFLLSLCLYIVLEAIPRFVWPPEIEAGYPFIGIAAAGLVVNTIGTAVFAVSGLSHGHSHGGHGHSHGEQGHSHKKRKKEHHRHHGEAAESTATGDSDEVDFARQVRKRRKDWNMWAVFIHYLGDMISSFIVLLTGILLHFVSGKWTLYIDPVSSLLIVGIIIYTTVPLVKQCSLILLQSTPSDVRLSKLRQDLQAVTGVESVHDLHVWQLVDGMFIGSVHLHMEEGIPFTPTMNRIKEIFHDYGIHSTTIQPEFVPKNHPIKQFCETNCVRECTEDWCCANLKHTDLAHSHDRGSHHV